MVREWEKGYSLAHKYHKRFPISPGEHLFFFFFLIAWLNSMHGL